MKISEAFPSNYLKADDLRGNQVKVKMDRTTMEEVGRDKERRLILYFIGKEKGMVLNKTNSNTIAAAYGDDTDNWEGADLILFESMVDYQGKSVPAIRVKVPPRAPAGRREETRRVDPPREDHREREDREENSRRPAPAMAPADIDDDIPF